MLLPSKHAGTRNDHRHRDREKLHTGESEVAAEPEKAWDRDHDAAARLREYNAEFQVEEVAGRYAEKGKD